MSEITGWASAICFAALACVMLEFLSPSGKMEKMVRFVLSAFMLCALFKPMLDISKIKFEFDISKKNDYKVSGIKKGLENQAMSIAASNIEKLVENEMEKIKITPKKIQVIMDTSDVNSISINRLIIKIDKKNLDRQEEVKQLVYKELGLVVEVTS